MKIKNPFTFWKKRSRFEPDTGENKDNIKSKVSSISPGRVSVPEDSTNFTSTLHGLTQMVTPSFRVEVIQLIRRLYKVNPDMAIAIQETFKLANTGHMVTFPNNTDSEAEKMRNHLKEATKKWSTYSAGIDGLVNKMIVQLMVEFPTMDSLIDTCALPQVSFLIRRSPDQSLLTAPRGIS